MKKHEEETTKCEAEVRRYEAQAKEARNTVNNLAWAVQVSDTSTSYRLFNNDALSVWPIHRDDASPSGARGDTALSFQDSILPVR